MFFLVMSVFSWQTFYPTLSDIRIRSGDKLVSCSCNHFAFYHLGICYTVLFELIYCNTLMFDSMNYKMLIPIDETCLWCKMNVLLFC